MAQQAGQKLIQHYFNNTGGINLSDSFLAVKDEQALGGYNYEYIKTGGIQKSLCPWKINASADANLRTVGLALRNPKDGDKSIIRCADRKVQNTYSDGSFVNLIEDVTSANTNILAIDNTTVVNHSMFVTPSTDVMWLSGGGMSNLYGAYSMTGITKNGVVEPTGVITATESGGGADFPIQGLYWYAITYHKASTGAESNASLDVSVTTVAKTNSVILDWSGLTNLDTTRYDKIYIYRSAINGVTGFTAGDIIAQIDATETSYTDIGDYISTAEVVPRAGNTLLDNSALTDGTYNALTTFKRRLVTAKGSTLFLSDINKPESWPLTNTITIPSGGPITALGIVSFTTPYSNGADELLAIYKDTELWVVTGSTFEDFALKFIDNTGCANQQLLVNASGYLYFMDSRGIYLWDGAGKPYYVSRIIEDLFGTNGKLDRSKLNIGTGVFFRRQNEVVWYLSHADIGEQKFIIKLDLRQTLPQVTGTLSTRIMDGCFLLGKVNDPVYACDSFIFPTASNQEDILISGDNAGYTYRQFYSSQGNGANDYDFTYETKFFDMGMPRVVKRYSQVVVWVENLGNWDLTLDYWTDFRTRDAQKNSVSVTLNANTDGTVALWDIAYWDQASWDDYSATPKALVFNLTGAPNNNAEGEVIKLRFKNSNSNQPITIYGFSIIYSEQALRN
jgi:hypothetical protein